MTPAEAPPQLDHVAAAREIGERFRATAAERNRTGTPPHEEMRAVRAAGLTTLRIPREFGGQGLGWPEAVEAVGELSRLDPGVGSLLTYHLTNFIPDLLDYETDGEDWQRRTAEHRWLWSNVTQPWVPFRADPTPDGGFVLNGVKPYNTGVRVADLNTVLVPRSDRRAFVYLALPTDREGITYHDDWDAFGLRRSDTVTMTFTDVVARPEEVLRDTHPGERTGFPPLYLQQGNLAFAAILVGVGQGVLDRAREWVAAFGSPLSDAELTERLGALAAQVEAVVAFRDQVAREVEDAYRRRKELTVPEIVEQIQLTEQLRLYAARVGMEAGSEVFDLLGPDAADEAVGLDTYWRDVRIHSLHINPPVYHHRMVGDVHLNGSGSTGPSFFLD